MSRQNGRVDSAIDKFLFQESLSPLEKQQLKTSLDVPELNNASVNAAIAEDPEATRGALNLGTAATMPSTAFQRVILGPFADDSAAALGGVSVGEVYKASGGALAWREHDPDVLAYQAERSLPEPLAVNLSNFVGKIKGAGLTIAQLYALRSEYLARDGSTYHAVIGNDGTVSGTVDNNATGAALAASSYIQFTNPIQSTALSEFGIFAGASMAVEPTTAVAIVSGYGGGSARGPSLGIAGIPGITPGGTTRQDRAAAGSLWEIAGSATPASNRRSPIPIVLPTGNKALLGMAYFSGQIRVTSGLYTDGGGSGLASAWNNGTTLRIGQRADSVANSQASEVDFVLVLSDLGDYAASEAALRNLPSVILGAATEHGLHVPTNMIALAHVGDSMTTVRRAANLSGVHNSAWAGAPVGVSSQGGQPLSVIRPLFEAEKARLLRLPHQKYMFFWGGYNLSADGYTFATPEGRAAYLAELMEWSAELAEAGIQSVHWTALVSGTATGTDITNTSAYNDALVAACQEAGYLVYDHRLTFSSNQFDGPSRTEAYFSDTIHLSDAGIDAITADFVSRVPAPTNPFHED